VKENIFSGLEELGFDDIDKVEVFNKKRKKKKKLISKRRMVILKT
jgi:hypothetical protein